MTSVSVDQVLGFRVARQRLDRRAPAGSLVAVARALCGVHAQLASSAELSLRARVEGLERDDVRAALEAERTLVKTWAMRGTLHLLPSDDLALYVAVLGPQWDDPGGAWLRGYGITKEQYDAILENVPRALGARPRTREWLADRLAELAGPDVRERVLSGWGSLLKPSARRGDLCFGPSQGRNVTFVRPDRWLGRLERLEATEAGRELVRRYLGAYGPATADDLGRWLGFRGARLKRLFATVQDELEEVEVEGEKASLFAADVAELRSSARPASVRLLPAFDPFVVGARPRSYLVAAKHEPRIFRPQAWFSPVVLVDGRAAGIWSHERRGRALRVAIEPFTRLSAATRKALTEEVELLAAFLGAPAELSVAA
jgi:hypothetical protein